MPSITGCGVAFPPTTPAGSNPGDVYVTCSEVQATTPSGHLFITRDRGATFQPLRGDGSGADLPDVAVRAVRYDASDASGGTLYVATDVGVYRSLDAGKTWRRFGTGLPRVKVIDLYVARDGSFVRISTSGRGLWEARPRG
jgi:photosystem II stability/assembly factor-like uncharacterized protein